MLREPALGDVNTLKKTSRQWWAVPFRSDNSWNVTWHTLLEYYPTASLGAIGWVLTFSFHGLVLGRECASCHTGGNPKINVASGSQPSSPLDWKWDLFPSQLSPWPILEGFMDRMYRWPQFNLFFRSSLTVRYRNTQEQQGEKIQNHLAIRLKFPVKCFAPPYKTKQNKRNMRRETGQEEGMNSWVRS